MLRTDVFCIRKKVCNRPGCAINLWDTLYNFNKIKFIISKILFKIVITIFNYIKNLKVV